MKKPPFISGAFHHIYNRGVEKRAIFMDDEDLFRFIHDLYEFNDEELSENIYYKRHALKSYEVEPHKRVLLVKMLAYCLMPNHFHLFFYNSMLLMELYVLCKNLARDIPYILTKNRNELDLYFRVALKQFP